MMTTFSCSYMFILLTESMTCIFLPSSPLRLRSFHFYISFSAFTTIVPAYLRLYFVPVLALQSSLYHLSHTVSHSCLYPIPAFQPYVSRATTLFPLVAKTTGYNLMTRPIPCFHFLPHCVYGWNTLAFNYNLLLWYGVCSSQSVSILVEITE